MDKENFNKAKEKAAPEIYEGNNYLFELRNCPGYEGYVPKNLKHEVCKYCGCIHYYH